MFRTAVIAGTPVDTQMGVDYINGKNEEAGALITEPHYCPVAEDCDAQVRFQYSSPEAKRAKIDGIFDAEISEGVHDFFIYCNSLSGAFDFDNYAKEKTAETGVEIRVYTPLQVYRELGRKYNRLGVMSANNLSAFGIEQNLIAANKDIYMIGTGNMAIVSAIEKGLPPEQIISDCGLDHLVRYFEACGCEALVLGCTHFPYFKEELAGISSLPLIDPADEMFRAMTEAAGRQAPL